MSVVLVADGLVLRYASGPVEVAALGGVDLRVSAGELLALVGPSGSGKSSLCHLAAGFERPSAGSVEVCGVPADTIRDWQTVAFVPQQSGLVAELTAAESLALPWLRAGRRPHRHTDLLAALGIGHLADRLVAQASIGEQQRVAVARAMVLTPTLLVLDEPTGHQDDDHVDLVLAALVAAARAGSAVLVATHDPRVVAVADRVVRLGQGRVVG